MGDVVTGHSCPVLSTAQTHNSCGGGQRGEKEKTPLNVVV